VTTTSGKPSPVESCGMALLRSHLGGFKAPFHQSDTLATPNKA
jgi:hypothetical protein